MPVRAKPAAAVTTRRNHDKQVFFVTRCDLADFRHKRFRHKRCRVFGSKARTLGALAGYAGCMQVLSWIFPVHDRRVIHREDELETGLRYAPRIPWLSADRGSRFSAD